MAKETLLNSSKYMKTDYELCIDFCKAEVVTRTKDWVEVECDQWGYTIYIPGTKGQYSLPSKFYADVSDSVNAMPPRNATPCRENPLYTTLAHMLGLKSAWIACADRLPENGTWICSDGVDSFEARIRNGIAFVHDGCHQKARAYTHWQPLPAKP